MRYRSIVLLGVVSLLLISCDLGVNSNGKPKAYPLESKVGFHIGPVIDGNSRLSLFLWTMTRSGTVCDEIDGSFWFHIPSRQVKYSVDRVIEWNGQCVQVFAPALEEWPFPDLPSGRYSLALNLHYGFAALIEDKYTLDVVNRDSIVVTPIKADSSSYYVEAVEGWL